MENHTKEYLKGDTIECFYYEQSIKGLYLGYKDNIKDLLRIIDCTGKAIYVNMQNNNINNHVETCRMVLVEKVIEIKSIVMATGEDERK
jgi:hypothetical protein